MSLAFWRRKNTTRDAPGSGSSRTTVDGDDPGRPDPTSALRARARRRLIGAAALLLLVVIVVPMVLDPEPKPVADNIPIDIPSEKTKFSPRLALPPVPAPDNVPLAPPPDARASVSAGHESGRLRAMRRHRRSSAAKPSLPRARRLPAPPPPRRPMSAARAQ